MFDSPTSGPEDQLRELLAGLSRRGGRVPLASWVDVVARCQAVVNTAQAVQTVALAHVAAIEDVVLEDGTVVEQFRGLGHERLDAPALVSDLLGLTAQGAATRMSTAVHLCSRLPEVVQVMLDGEVDSYRAGVVSDELRDASPEACRAVALRVAPKLGSEPTGRLRRRVRRELAVVDAECLRERAERARTGRSLQRWAGDQPGMDTWVATLPTEVAGPAWAAVDKVARGFVKEGRCSNAEQARADAMTALILGQVTAEVVFQVPVPVSSFGRLDAAAPADGAAAVQPVGAAVRSGGRPTVHDDSVGPRGSGHRDSSRAGAPGTVGAFDERVEGLTAGLPPQVQASISEALAAYPLTRGADPTGPAQLAAVTTRVQVVPCSDGSGALAGLPVDVDGTPVGANVDPAGQANRGSARPLRHGHTRLTDLGVAAVGEGLSTSAYRPSPRIARFVRARDRHCRFPGCRVRARYCDIDHVLRWPSGPTEPPNLICLCRRHHRVKQMARWRVRMEADARVLWTDPTGRTRTTVPDDRLRVETPVWLDRARSAARPVREGQQAHPGPFTDEAVVAVLWSSLEEELEHLLDHATRKRHDAGPQTTSQGQAPAHSVAGRAGDRSGLTLSADQDPPF